MFHFIGRRQLDIVSAIPTFHACVTRRRVRRGALSLLTNAGGVLEVDACLTYSGPVRSDTSADHIVIRINDGDVSSPADSGSLSTVEEVMDDVCSGNGKP